LDPAKLKPVKLGRLTDVFASKPMSSFIWRLAQLGRT